MQSSSTFIRISGFIPEVKKNLHWSIIGKILFITQMWRIRAKQGVGKRVWVWEAAQSQDIFKNLPSCKFGNSISVLKLIQNCYINMNISFFFFFLKTGSLFINWVLLSPTNILCLKYYPHNLTKYEV